MRALIAGSVLLLVQMTSYAQASVHDEGRAARCSTQLSEAIGRCSALYSLPQLASQLGYCETTAITTYNDCMQASSTPLARPSLIQSPSQRPQFRPTDAKLSWQDDGD